MDFVRCARRDSESDVNSGWRRAAQVNTKTLIGFTIFLFICLVASAGREKSLTKANIFYSGTCNGGSASRMNIALHLLLNVVSTALFASSNFFMQVLNSPSRREVDKAHAAGTYLGIGVPSVRNAFLVSKFKTACWALFLLSSIPMHLLFNSMIFQTDYNGNDYELIIANADFVNGAQYFVPGASLVPTAQVVGYDSVGSYNMDTTPTYNMSDYQDSGSTIRSAIDSMARDAHSWDSISITDCYNDYVHGRGMRSHRKVIVVVDHSPGWIRNEVWNFPANRSDFWEPLVPGNETNSLWYYSPCSMIAEHYNVYYGFFVSNTCGAAFDSPQSSYTTSSRVAKNDWQISFFSRLSNEMFMSPYYSNHDSVNDTALILDNGKLWVSYCLVEPVERVCQVGIHNALLLSIAFCVLVKTLTAIVVTRTLGRRGEQPLVTLGDAIASFIQHPDNSTTGLCTLDQKQIRQFFWSSEDIILAGPRKWQGDTHRRWSVVPCGVWFTSYLLFVISITVAATFFGLAYDGSGLNKVSFSESENNPFTSGISWTFTSGVLAANSPQLLLSCCYLAYNNLFTRLQMAKEWAQFSTGYRPLRVTDPRGQQYSTYRLQLPYKYSIPLIICSIILHWLLSNAIYTFISSGGFYTSSTFSTGTDYSFPHDMVVVVGYSVVALLSVLVVATLLALVPIGLSFKKLPNGIVTVGNNSIAISAACHASLVAKTTIDDDDETLHLSRVSSRVLLASSLEPSPASYLPLQTAGCGNSNMSTAWSDGQDVYGPEVGGRANADAAGGIDHGGIELHRLTLPKNSENSIGSRYSVGQMSKEELLESISQSRVCWGVVQMPPEFHCKYDFDQEYEHLGFGVQGGSVSPPVEGHYYV